MLGILLMILKVIGWVLLAVLALLLLVVCLVLFVPIPYRVWVSGSPEDDPAVCCKVKVFGIQVFPRKGKKAKAAAKAKADTADGAEPAEESAGAPKEPGTAAQQPAGTNTENTEKNNIEKNTEKKTEGHSAGKETETAQPSGKKQKKKQTKKQKKKRPEGIWDTVKRIRTELTDAGNRRAVSHLLRETKQLLHHIGPRHIRADVSFSLGDPANTGYATAALSVCPFVYGEKCRITPDFVTDKLYLKGWMDVRGHVCTFHAVAAGLRLLFDRDIRKIIKKLRR